MNSRELEHLGEPDLQIGNLRLWIHGLQFPKATDYWDGNFLRVTAYCGSPDSAVRVHGSFIHLSEIDFFLQEAQHIYQTLKGTAALNCMEPNLNVLMNTQTGGHIAVTINITPDHMTESHTFKDQLDQSYLPAIIKSCKQILKQYELPASQDHTSRETQRKAILPTASRNTPKRKETRTLLGLLCLIVAPLVSYAMYADGFVFSIGLVIIMLIASGTCFTTFASCQLLIRSTILRFLVGVVGSYVILALLFLAVYAVTGDWPCILMLMPSFLAYFFGFLAPLVVLSGLGTLLILGSSKPAAR